MHAAAIATPCFFEIFIPHTLLTGPQFVAGFFAAKERIFMS